MIRFRVDDFPLTKPEEAWRHNLDAFKRFNDAMVEGGFDYVLGCIPRHTTQEHLLWLSQQANIEVAMHGLGHDERFPNEFRDHQTQADICQAIRGVREPWNELVGPVTAYIPPHNVVDPKTVRALKELGFTHLYGGPGSDESVVRAATDMGLVTVLTFPPFHYGRSDEMLAAGAVEYLREVDGNPELGSDVHVTLHWTWENNIGLSSLREFLGGLRCRT